MHDKEEDSCVEINEGSINSGEGLPERRGRKRDVVGHTQEPGHPQNPAYDHNKQESQSDDNPLLTGTATDRTEYLDNTPHLTNKLNQSTAFKETTTGVNDFDRWFERNERVLLRDNLDTNMVSKLQKDKVVTTETPVCEVDGLPTRLGGYFANNTENRHPEITADGAEQGTANHSDKNSPPKSNEVLISFFQPPIRND